MSNKPKNKKMKKKYLFSLMAILMMAMASVSFVSCGSDDDDEEMGGMDDDTRMIVGVWHKPSSSLPSWTFEASGDCLYEYYSKDRTGAIIIAKKTGVWNYNPANTVLSTTISNMSSYLVTNLTPTMMTLASMNGNGSTTWVKGD
jgi:hypothetical protein